MVRRRAVAAICLLAVVAVPSLAGVSSPRNLGAAGLCASLSLRLWHWTELSGWASASAAGITCDELGSGEYAFDGLPTATGPDRYELVVALASDPETALDQYGYGAQPGRRILWGLEYEPLAEPWEFKQHDTHGSISLTILRGLPSEIGVATASFTMIDTSGVAKVLSQPASIINIALDETSGGTYTAAFVYDWQATDLDTAGRFRGEFEITYPGPPITKETLPRGEPIRLRVRPDFDGS